MVYIFFFIMALLVFGAVSSDNVIIGGTVGNVHKNAPHILTNYTFILSLLGLLIAAAFFNNAALRDHEFDFHQILFSTPLSKASYFLGRFFGAFVLSTVPITGIYLGFTLASWIAVPAGWLEPDRLGPVPYQAFLTSYLFVVMPNMFFAGSIIFAVATRWKSTIISFTGTMGIIVLYIISGTLTSDLENESIASMVDAFGIRTYGIEAKYFTPAQKNSEILALQGMMLWNRLLWIGVGCLVLAVSYFGFSFQQKNKSRNKEESAPEKLTRGATRPMVQQLFTPSTRRLHFWSFFKAAFRSIVKSPTFKILFFFSLLLYLVDLFQGFEAFGLQSYPVSYKMNDAIENASSLFILIVIVFFSGELIWRDRMHHINEVMDATPHNSFGSLLGKLFALVSAAVLIDVFMIFLGMGYQLANGYFRVEPMVYFGHLIIDRLPGYLVWSMVLIFLQVLINQRYIAYFASILLLFLLDILWLVFDVQSNLLDIGSQPQLTYSDMNGFGDGMLATAWFTLYWLLFGGMLMYLAAFLWSRGKVSRLSERWVLAKQQLKSRAGFVFYALCAVWLVTGGFIYYNTHVLNSYLTSEETEALQVRYEKSFKQFQDLPMPKYTAIQYDIAIYPDERNVIIKAEATLRNETEVPIHEIHFTVDKNWNQVIQLPGGVLSFEDEDNVYRKYTMDQPLMPGEKLVAQIEAAYLTKGFENEVSQQIVASNGTFINNADFMPSIGYSKRIEISDKNDRKSNGLPTKARMPKLQSPCGEPCDKNYLTEGTSDWVEVETIISTSANQIAIAPGSLKKKWNEEGRNHYHYVVDRPSLNFYSFMSAEYEIARREWNGVDIEVYYDHNHPENVERMLDAVERSLDYYTKNFGPYYHNQARIIEFPRYQSFAQAFPGTMPYSESIGFIADLRDEEDNNIVDAVVAHEMAHQWWAHQEMSANMQGGTMLTESFAEYSSLMVMKQISTPMQMRQFLKYDHERYLRGRSQETDVERPLYKVENQSHIHYGKGSVILFALQDYIGEDSVNAALHDFLMEWAYKGPPYPNSLDFLKHLENRVPDSLSFLIDDWFKEITLYDHRLNQATYTQRGDGKYEVTLEVYAQKVKADTLGNESYQDPNDWVYIGLFADDDEKDLMLEKRVKFDQKEMSFTLVVDSLPVKAAVDPRRVLIERIYSDNIRAVRKSE